MRLKKLFLLVAAMVLSIPTMFAQEPVYFAYNTSTGKFNSLTEAGQLTYNADSQTYTGQIEMVQSSATGNKSVIFFTGSAASPTTVISNTSGGAFSSLKFDTPLNSSATNTNYGWYVTKPVLEAAGGDSSVEAKINVTINMSQTPPTVTFSLVKDAEEPENPENFYVWTNDGSGWVNAGALSPTEAGGTTYTGNISTTLNNQSFLLSPRGGETFQSGTAYGQKGDITGGSQTKDVNLSTPGSSTSITMAQGTVSTTINNAGEYTFEFDYSALSLKVTLVALDVLNPSQLRVVKGTGPSSFDSPSSSDPVLTRQSDGTYVGSFEVSGRPAYFKFYGTTSGTTVYFGPERAASMSFSTVSTVNQTVTNADAVDGVQYWAVGTYPQNNFVTTGTVTAVVNLKAGTVEFTLQAGTPATLYLHTTSGATNYTPIKNVAATPTDGIFTWELEGPAYFLVNANATAITQFGLGPNAAETEINVPYTATWQFYSAGQYKLGHIANTGNYTIVMDYAAKSVSVISADAEEDTNLYMHFMPRGQSTATWAPSSDDPVLTEDEDGYYTATVENVAAGSYFKFYTKDLFGNPTWIGPEFQTNVNFDENPQFAGSYDQGTSAWRIAYLVDEAETSTVTFSINLDSKKVVFTDETVQAAPEAMYLWVSSSNDDEGNPVYTMVATLSDNTASTLAADATPNNVYEGTYDFPAGSMFYIGQSPTSATYKAFNAAYENFSDAGGSSVSGTAPTVKFTDGKYVVTLYRGTVAPTGAPLTSISFPAGGKYDVSFDWATKQLTLSEPVEPCTLVFTFEGSNFEVETADINNYLNIVDQAELMGSEGEYTGQLNITSNPYTYKYTEYYPTMAMLSLSPKDGYTIENVAAATEVEGLSIQGGNGNWMISASALYGTPITITISANNPPVPNDAVRFVFSGIEDPLQYLKIQDVLNEDGDDITVTGNPWDFKFNGMAVIMIGINNELENKDQYAISVTSEDPQVVNQFWIQENEAEANGNMAKAYMIVMSQAAYGYTVNVEVTQVNAPNKVTFVFAGDQAQGTAQAFRQVKANVTKVTEDYGMTEETIYFTDADYTFTYEYAAFVEFEIVDGSNAKIVNITCDESSADAYDIDGTELGLWPGANGYTFTINIDLNTGVESIYDIDGDNLTIVNMQGVVLKKNAKAADLNSLDKGIYIVNGKKVVVRK